jgi:transcriptional regulator with XRE-family HTH domain
MSTTLATKTSAFWDDLAEDLKDPEFLREFVRESVRIATIDAMVNELNEAREAAELSKAQLAKAVGADPAAIRRLFSASHTNPTLGTLAELAAALGMRVTLEPFTETDCKLVTKPILEGVASNRKAVAKHASAMRERRRQAA